MDVFDIGVKMSMINGVSAVLAVIQKDVMGLHHAVDLTSGKFSKMQAAAVAFSGVVIGGAMIAGLTAMTKLGDKWIEQMNTMKNQVGMTPAEMDMADKAANANSSVIRQTTPVENNKTIVDLRQVLGDTHEAVKNLELFSKVGVLAGAGMGDMHKGREQILGYAQALELMGVTNDHEKTQFMLDKMLKASQAYGFNERVSGDSFSQAMKYSGGPARGLFSPQYMGEYMPMLMQELTGSTAGVAQRAFFKEVIGGNTTHAAIEKANNLGLIDPAKIIKTSTGSIKGLQPGAWIGHELAASNPYMWVQEYLIPALAKKGITDKEQINAVIGGLFPNQGAQMVSIYANQQVKAEKDRALALQAKGVAGYDAAQTGSPLMGQAAVDAQLERIGTDLTKSLSMAKIALLNRFADSLSKLADVLEAHPTATAWIVGITAALAGFLVVAGTIALIGVAIAALVASPIALIITGIGTALVALGVAIMLIPWTEVWAATLRGWHVFVDWLKGIGTTIANAYHVTATAVVEAWETAKGRIMAIGTSMSSAISTLVTNIATMFANIPSQIWDWVRGHAPAALGGGATSAPNPPAALGGGATTAPNAPAPIPGVLPQAGANLMHPASFRAPSGGGNGQPIHITTVTTLDGRVIASVVNRVNGDQMDRRPSTGTTGFDARQGRMA